MTDIELALFAHWSIFGQAWGARLHDEEGILWLETPLRSLPYNGVIRTRLPASAEADAAIDEVLARYRARGADAFWFVHPTATPGDLAERLTERGVPEASPITCMSLDLDDWDLGPGPQGIAFTEAADIAALGTYTELTIRCWAIPADQQQLLARVHQDLAPGSIPGRRYLALDGDTAVGKGYLSLAGPPGVGAIFGMSVVPEARGRGIASGLTTALLARAAEEGCERVVLHSTPEAEGVYRRAGFTEQCGLGFHATRRGTTSP